MTDEPRTPTPPDEDRTVPPDRDYPGMTQIRRAGRCFQLRGIGPDVDAALEAFATDRIMKDRIA